MRSDRFTCPITLSIMRHPVAVIDSENYCRFYELKAIYGSIKRIGLIDPISKEAIISIGHVADLEQEIDNVIKTDLEAANDRYSADEYAEDDKRTFMKKIQAELDQKPISLASFTRLFKGPGVRSILTGVSAYLAVTMAYQHLLRGISEQASDKHAAIDVKHSSSIPIALMVGLLDYGIRHISGSRYSIPSILFDQIPGYLFDQGKRIVNRFRV